MKVFVTIDVPDDTDLDMCSLDYEVYKTVNPFGDTETVAKKKGERINTSGHVRCDDDELWHDVMSELRTG